MGPTCDSGSGVTLALDGPGLLALGQHPGRAEWRCRPAWGRVQGSAASRGVCRCWAAWRTASWLPTWTRCCVWGTARERRALGDGRWPGLHKAGLLLVSVCWALSCGLALWSARPPAAVPLQRGFLPDPCLGN